MGTAHQTPYTRRVPGVELEACPQRIGESVTSYVFAPAIYFKRLRRVLVRWGITAFDPSHPIRDSQAHCSLS